MIKWETLWDGIVGSFSVIKPFIAMMINLRHVELDFYYVVSSGCMKCTFT